MSKTIKVSIPHHLSEAEVKARIIGAVADLRRQYPAYAGSLQESWAGDTMEFKVSAMGQAVTGRAKVEPQVVHLHVDLPIFLAMLADTLRPRLEAEGRKLLSGPKAPKK